MCKKVSVLDWDRQSRAILLSTVSACVNFANGTDIRRRIPFDFSVYAMRCACESHDVELPGAIDTQPPDFERLIAQTSLMSTTSKPGTALEDPGMPLCTGKFCVEQLVCYNNSERFPQERGCGTTQPMVIALYSVRTLYSALGSLLLPSCQSHLVMSLAAE